MACGPHILPEAPAPGGGPVRVAAAGRTGRPTDLSGDPYCDLYCTPRRFARMPRSITDRPYMSLLLPTPTIASSRRDGTLSALAGALAVTAALMAAPAFAQNGPLSLAAPAAPPTGPRSADPGMVPAEKAVKEKRYTDAVADFDRVLATNPRNAQARFQRAWSLAQAGREDEAIKAFSDMAQDFPELPEPHNNLALLYAKRGDLKRAEAELLAALDAKPDYAVAYSNLGDVYRRLAEQAYGEAVRRNPGDARAAGNLRQLQPDGATPSATTPATAPAGKASGTPASRRAPASAPAAR
ncbi:Tetratricopeptide repeat-containing protein [Cupriavidus sp. YR651]|nr:Tetratricopeptide repeat-containing protein [Cupriavidus sp. YR651]